MNVEVRSSTDETASIITPWSLFLSKPPPRITFARACVSPPLLQLNNPARGGDGDRLCAMRRSKFFHDMLDMNLDRLFRDGRTVCYLSISIALRDALLWAIEIVDLGKHQRLCRLAASLCLRETPPSDVRLNLI